MTQTLSTPKKPPLKERFKHPVVCIAVCLILDALVGLLDWITGSELSFSIFFLIPVSIASWFLGLLWGFFFCFTASLTWLTADLFSGNTYTHPLIPYWNAAVRFGFFSIVTLMFHFKHQADKRVYQLMKVKSDFTAMVSHELRTPMAAVKEGIKIILDGILGPVNEDQKIFLQIAQRNANRLIDLVNNILDFEKIENKKRVFLKKFQNLNSLIEDLLQFHKPLIDAKGLKLETRLMGDPPALEVDPNAFIQLITNLISNAINFTEKGTITVATHLKKDQFIIEVSDTGCGIDQNHFQKLFEPFEQAGNIISGKPAGTGLGLAIAKGIVEAHQGRIWMESALNKGTTFFVSLPLPPPGSSKRTS